VTNVGANPVIITGFSTLLPATYTSCAIASCPAGGSCTPSFACPSGTCAVGFPFYPGGLACTGTSFPFQVCAARGVSVAPLRYIQSSATKLLTPACHSAFFLAQQLVDCIVPTAPGVVSPQPDCVELPQLHGIRA